MTPAIAAGVAGFVAVLAAHGRAMRKAWRAPRGPEEILP